MTARSWVFTWNNPDVEQIDWQDLDKNEKVRYASWQLESGENGTKHFQGYVELSGPQRLSGVRNILGKAHWEPRRGTRQQARAYTRKEESRLSGPWEYGQWSGGGQGARTDWAGLKDKLKSGASELDILEDNPREFFMYNRGIQRALSLLPTKKRTWKTEVYLLVGPTGTGKSYWAFTEQSEKKGYVKQRSNWWDGYNGEADVILDDFYGWLPFDELLRLGDENPLLIQTKGGQAQFLAKRVFITSNRSPDLWYSSEKVRPYLAAFYRRVTKAYWCPERGVRIDMTDDLAGIESLSKNMFEEIEN